MSNAALRPSLVTASMLSSLGETLPLRMASARSTSVATNAFRAAVGFAVTVSRWKRGTGSFNMSAVRMSATSRNIVISSGRFTKRANRVFMRYLPPSGDNSRAVTDSPKLPAQVSNCAT